MNNAIHFLLAPDRSAARYIRRKLTDSNGWLNVVVGTWPELLELARSAYLIREPSDIWDEKLSEIAENITDAFWAQSFEVAKNETLTSIGYALRNLLAGIKLDESLRSLLVDGLPHRAEEHIKDLIKLHEGMNNILPAELDVAKSILRQAESQAIKKVSVYRIEGLPKLFPWQQQLIEKLNSDSDSCRDEEYIILLQNICASTMEGASSKSLSLLKENLFSEDPKQEILDDSLQWIGARDLLEEVEVVAGMIQEQLKNDKSLKWSDIGILVPDDQNYKIALQDVFHFAGIPVSGLPEITNIRDLGHETALYFLLSRRKPAPIMAIASLLTSPLMPWTEEIGNTLAQQLMEGDFRFKSVEGIADQGEKMLGLLRQQVETAEELSSSLSRFFSYVSAGEEFAVHFARLISIVEKLVNYLQGKDEIVWEELIHIASPKRVDKSRNVELTREGVGVFIEHEEPWRRIRSLFVLGFTEGHYPTVPSQSAVFLNSDLELIKRQTSCELETQTEFVNSRRELFLRQLNMVEDQVTFLISRLDILGSEIKPSLTLAFSARLFKGIEDHSELIFDLDSEEERKKIKNLAVPSELTPVAHRELKYDDLNLQRDLLYIRTNEDGTPKHQSPSRLEKLMATPLAWLLDSASLLPLEWAPEELDSRARGSLAHEVFEHLFAKDKPLPDSDAIKAEIPKLLNQAIIRIKPFLLAPEWHVERHHLQRDIEVAALRWCEILISIGADILGAEVWLSGTFSGISIRGKADLLLQLPDDSIFVIDYKKSKSDNRRKIMETGYDSQASLYRIMIETGDNKLGKDDDTLLKPNTDSEINVLYYLMNDQIALSDSSGQIGVGLAGFEEMGRGISQNAIPLIKERISEIQNGVIKLNKANDEVVYEKKYGIKIYALDDSPLIRLFMHPEEEVDA